MVNRVDLAVDSVSGQIKRRIIATDDQGVITTEIVDAKIDDLGENTSELEYRNWMIKAFLYDKFITSVIVIPLLVLSGVGVWFAYVYTGQLMTLIPALLVTLIITYNILNRIVVGPVMIIMCDPISNEYFMREDDYWISDIRKFPKECWHLNQDTGKWVPWFDQRTDNSIFDPWQSQQEFDAENVNASDVMGTESYLKTTYNIGSMRPKRSFLEESGPNLMLIVGGFAATFFAADRIAELLKLNP